MEVAMRNIYHFKYLSSLWLSREYHVDDSIAFSEYKKTALIYCLSNKTGRRVKQNYNC